MRLNPTFFDCAESALIADFGLHYDKSLSLAILGISEKLSDAGPRGFKESIPALSSLTIFYDPLELSREELVIEIEELCKLDIERPAATHHWEIPVTYGGGEGPDLDDVASRLGLTPDGVAELHSKQSYHVYMLGFMPGFAYLGDLPEELRLPRRATPRARVPKGSLAITSDMTAIYTHESPGGWHLIGKTPVALWDMERSKAPLFQPGDKVKFKQVSEQEARDLERLVNGGWTPAPLETA